MNRNSLTLIFLLGLTIPLWAAETGKRHHEPSGGFSYCPPKGWTMKELAGMKYQLAFGEPADGFAPNINVVDEAFAGSLKDYVKSNVETLTKVFQNLGQTEFKTDAGLKGMKLITESEQQGKRLRQRFFFFEDKDGKKLVVTCSTMAEGGSKLDSIFEASLKTFAVDK